MAVPGPAGAKNLISRPAFNYYVVVSAEQLAGETSMTYVDRINFVEFFFTLDYNNIDLEIKIKRGTVLLSLDEIGKKHYGCCFFFFRFIFKSCDVMPL